MHVCVCIYTYTYIHIHTYIHIYVYIVHFSPFQLLIPLFQSILFPFCILTFMSMVNRTTHIVTFLPFYHTSTNLSAILSSLLLQFCLLLLKTNLPTYSMNPNPSTSQDIFYYYIFSCIIIISFPLSTRSFSLVYKYTLASFL